MVRSTTTPQSQDEPDLSEAASAEPDPPRPKQPSNKKSASMRATEAARRETTDDEDVATKPRVKPRSATPVVEVPGGSAGGELDAAAESSEVGAQIYLKLFLTLDLGFG
jgi:hypothetical protein